MKASEIIEGNKLITDFNGRGKCSFYGVSLTFYGTPHYPLNKIKYHKSWDWLMPVVEKIETLGFRVHTIEDYCEIYAKTNTSIPLIRVCCNPKIEATWRAVKEFIEQHNRNSL